MAELLCAIESYQSVDCVRSILESGVNVNHKSSQGGHTALHLCYLYQEREHSHERGLTIFKLLIKYGADVNARDYTFETPLMKCLRYKCKAEYVRTLLENGANVDLADKQGNTALHLYPVGVENMDYDTFKMIVDRCGEVNVRNVRGETPLVEFVRKGSTMDYVGALLEAGADARSVDVYGNGVLHFCSFYRFRIVSRLRKICKRTRDNPYPLRFSVNPDVIELLIARGADVNAKNNAGETPLIKFVKDKCNPCCVDVLLRKGARDFTPDNSGDTILHYFTRYKYSEANLALLKSLLDSGADPNLRNKSDQTPLIAFLTFESDFTYVETLLTYGATIATFDEDVGHTLAAYYRLHTLAQLSTMCKYMMLNNDGFAVPHVAAVLRSKGTLDDGMLEAQLNHTVALIVSELHDMKNTYIEDDLTFYALCMESGCRKLGAFSRRCDIDLLKAKERFPYYFPLIEHRWAVARKWRSILDRADALPFWSSGTATLNLDCLSHVFSFLTNHDLVNLSLAVEE